MPIEEIKLDGNLKEKLQASLLAVHVNRNTLSSKVSEESILIVDYMLNHVVGSIYASLILAIDGDEEKVNAASNMASLSLEDLQSIKEMLLNKSKEESAK